jgi:hypothetical protein
MPHQTTFTISQATPTIQISDAGGAFNGQPFAATATVAGAVAGMDDTRGPSLEGVGLTLDYTRSWIPMATCCKTWAPRPRPFRVFTW